MLLFLSHKHRQRSVPANAGLRRRKYIPQTRGSGDANMSRKHGAMATQITHCIHQLWRRKCHAPYTGTGDANISCLPAHTAGNSHRTGHGCVRCVRRFLAFLPLKMIPKYGAFCKILQPYFDKFHTSVIKCSYTCHTRQSYPDLMKNSMSARCYSAYSMHIACVLHAPSICICSHASTHTHQLTCIRSHVSAPL